MLSKIRTEKMDFGPRRAVYVDISRQPSLPAADGQTTQVLERFDVFYRTLVAILYNFAMSGHPGGSISWSRIIEVLHFLIMDYDLANPDREDADVFGPAKGHAALGVYDLKASINEIVRTCMEEFLPEEIEKQLRFEDLLGFRRNPVQDTPLFQKFGAKALDGHPTPLTPGIKLATGASGVGVPAYLGLAQGAFDMYGQSAPLVWIVEGEGGMTPGRVVEALAGASAAQLKNARLIVDWNQASIDSNQVCREKGKPGDYVQWDPAELLYLHDWNVIYVPEGQEFRQLIPALQLAKEGLGNDQPTAIVCKTVKGWRYGITGRTSHGAGHKFCSKEFYECLLEFEKTFQVNFPIYSGQQSPADKEQLYYDFLMIMRQAAETDQEMAKALAVLMADSEQRLNSLNRKPREKCPVLENLYHDRAIDPRIIPDELTLPVGASTTLRVELGRSLKVVNRITKGAVVVGSADLLGSTSVNLVGEEFPCGFYNAITNPNCRMIPVGGICEDGLGAWMAGLASYGHHLTVTSSYAAFIAALEHVPARLHCIGQQARQSYDGKPFNTWIIVGGHAGPKTGEDGPTHADPQALQLLQENFPPGMLVTLTPWDPQELWPLVITGLLHRPAVLVPFVTRPNEVVIDREKLKIPSATAAAHGMYTIRQADPNSPSYRGTIVLQGSAVMYEFAQYVLPRLDDEKIAMNIRYVTSAELFDLLPEEHRQLILNADRMREAMGITDFTMPTMYRWVTSPFGRRHSLSAFSRGKYSGSGTADKVLKEIGLDGPAQWEAVKKYIDDWQNREKVKI